MTRRPGTVTRLNRKASETVTREYWGGIFRAKVNEARATKEMPVTSQYRRRVSTGPNPKPG
jgi:hypothetical protein